MSSRLEGLLVIFFDSPNTHGVTGLDEMRTVATALAVGIDAILLETLKSCSLSLAGDQGREKLL